MLRMTILYPAGDDTTFDWDYYRDQHLALVDERWGEHLAKASEIARGVSGVPKGEPTYQAVTTVYFADRDALNAALRAGGTDIPNDLPNFTNTQPVMQIDEVL